jgi:hypothetical protein
MGDCRAWSHRGWDGDDRGVLASVQLWSWTPVTGRSLESPSPGLSPCQQPCQEVGTSACTPPGTGTHRPGLITFCPGDPTAGRRQGHSRFPGLCWKSQIPGVQGDTAKSLKSHHGPVLGCHRLSMALKLHSITLIKHLYFTWLFGGL